ncbi:MAG: hypothetical protein AAGD18_24910 [Actinomycetota bacterium]
MTDRFGIALVTDEVLDCNGRISHRLVLEIDGTVTIHFLSSGVTAQVEPATQAVLTPGVHVPQALMDHATSMRIG